MFPLPPSFMLNVWKSLPAPIFKDEHTVDLLGVMQELQDLNRDPPAQCSAGPVGDDRKSLVQLISRFFSGAPRSLLLKFKDQMSFRGASPLP